jgi:hypothetical protein
MKLTGYQRFQLTRIWHTKKDEHPDKEAFIKKVCKSKGIEYTDPVDLNIARNITRTARIFPTKKS